MMGAGVAGLQLGALRGRFAASATVGVGLSGLRISRDNKLITAIGWKSCRPATRLTIRVGMAEEIGCARKSQACNFDGRSPSSTISGQVDIGCREEWAR